MSDFNFDFSNKQEDQEKKGDKSTESNNGLPPASADKTNAGMGNLKNLDPNAINVQITHNAPVIVLWGPPSSGKSVAMIRLAQYLKNTHDITPIRNFRPNDPIYLKLCDDFPSFISTTIAPDSTKNVDFMLLGIEKDGDMLCQILEAPGEHYYIPQNPDADYPSYLYALINREMPKIYVFFLEIDWKLESERSLYDRKIANFFANIKYSDTIILLCNKSDKQQGFIYDGKPEADKYLKRLKELYPLIFRRLGNASWFMRIFKSERKRYMFVPFSAGNFTDSVDIKAPQNYIIGRDVYPSLLWDAIKKGIKGTWL